MTTLPEGATYDSGVYELQSTDPVQGNGATGATATGVSNKPLQNLTNRTGWLYNQIATLASEIAVLAPLNSPNFTGTPTTPNVSAGDSSNKVINSAFVQNAVGGVNFVSCAGGANVVLAAASYGCAVIVLQGAITANINVIFPTQAGKWVVANATTGAFSITCKTAGGSGIVLAQGTAATLFCDGTNIIAADSDFTRVGNLKATGSVIVPAATISAQAVNLGQFSLTAISMPYGTVFKKVTPDGEIVYYGSTGTPSSGLIMITFPAPFPTLVGGIQVTTQGVAGGIGDTVQAGNQTVNGFTVVSAVANGTQAGPISFFWEARGY